MREKTREEIITDRDYTLFGSNNNTHTTDVSKLVMPVTLALSLGWIIASFVYGAGNKVAASEKDIAYLVSKCDQLEKTIKDNDISNKATIKTDEEAIIELRVKLQSVKDYVSQLEITKGNKPLSDYDTWK